MLPKKIFLFFLLLFLFLRSVVEFPHSTSVFLPPHSPKGGVWLAPLCEPFESLWFKGKIVSVGKLSPLCSRCSSRGGGGVPPLAVFLRRGGGQPINGKLWKHNKRKGSPVYYSPTDLIGNTGKRERKRSVGAMRARIMRGRARVRVEGLKRGKDGRGGGSGLTRRAGLVF